MPLRACGDFARIYAEEAETSYIGVDSDFEDESRHFLFKERFAHLFFVGVIGVVTDNSGSIWKELEEGDSLRLLGPLYRDDRP